MSLEITKDLIARQSPEAQVIIRLLLAKIDELEAQIGRTPQNSSLPPGSQHPHARAAHDKPKSKRKRGGQKGHPRHERSLIPVAECDEVVSLRPTACRRCGLTLSGDDDDPLRHQVYEMPEIKPLVTEYQRHRLECACCQTSTCAALPEGVPTGQSGPKLIAFVALLMGCFRQSKRRTSLFLESLLGQPCSVGLAVKHQNMATAALRPCYEELVVALSEQKRLGIDESPSKEANKNAWLWTFVSERFSVFAIRTSRSAEILDDFLGLDYCGVVTCDRAKMYDRLPWVQWCWAHLKRDFQGWIDRGPPFTQQLGEKLQRNISSLFRSWRKFREETISRRGLNCALGRVRKSIERLLELTETCGYAPAEATARHLLAREERLWAFANFENVEPTNNASERALRHAVIWRKLSFGTQSKGGSRFVETMLSVIETCRQQDRSVFNFVSTALQSHIANQPAPTLLPGP